MERLWVIFESMDAEENYEVDLEELRDAMLRTSSTGPVDDEMLALC